MTTSVTYHAFLSYRSEDRPTVLRIADQLKKRGCDCFLDQWYLVPGRDWVEGLERALHASQSVVIFVGPTEEMGRWQQRERAWALDRQTRDTQFPVIPVLLPGCEPPLGFLSLLMWIDLRENLADSSELDRLAAVIRGEAVDQAGQRQSRNTICPYRGLQFFREEDAGFFFGRNTYIEQLTDKVGRDNLPLTDKVGRHNLVAVVGASGSGKSSVVRAGLLPKLRAPDTQAVWEIVTMVPRTAPLFSLANELLPLLEPELSRYERVSKAERAARDLKANEVSLRNLMSAVLDQQNAAGWCHPFFAVPPDAVPPDGVPPDGAGAAGWCPPDRRMVPSIFCRPDRIGAAGWCHPFFAAAPDRIAGWCHPGLLDGRGGQK